MTDNCAVKEKFAWHRQCDRLPGDNLKSGMGQQTWLVILLASTTCS